MRGATSGNVDHDLYDMFQSTRPMRGATDCVTDLLLGDVVSIHAPHAGRDGDIGMDGEQRRVSIHAPHAGRD